MGLEELDERGFQHISKIEPIKSLADSTEKLRARNDKLAEELRKDRASQPPSAPRQPAAAIVITLERAKAVARALRSNHTMLTFVSLVDVEGGPLTPAEFQAWADLAVKGAQSK